MSDCSIGGNFHCLGEVTLHSTLRSTDRLMDMVCQGKVTDKQTIKEETQKSEILTETKIVGSGSKCSPVTIKHKQLQEMKRLF